MVNFALNKTTGIIVTFLFLLVAVGYTTNSFSQTPSGNTTTICDPDERFDENLQECISIIPSNGNNDTDDSIKLCDPGEVLDTVSNICHEPCEPGQTFNPSTRTCNADDTGGPVIPDDGDLNGTIHGDGDSLGTTHSITTTTTSKGNKVITTTLINITSV